MWLLLLLGCAEEDLGPPWLELGGGEQSYIALDDGDELELVAGNQGGWHVDVSVRFGGVRPDDTALSYTATDDTDALVSYVTDAMLTEGGVVKIEDGWERFADRIVLDIEGADEVIGAALTLRVDCTAGEIEMSDAVSVTVVDEET